jgi:hypothetical protein
MYRLDPRVARDLDSSVMLIMPSPKDKALAGMVKTEVPGVWMVAAGVAGAKVPAEHEAFMKFLQQVSRSGLGCWV